MKKQCFYLLSSFLLLTLIIASCEKEEEEKVLDACFAFPDTLYAGLPAQFDASCSDAADSYQWDFGDGEFGSGKKISHTFETAGKYKVSLLISNVEGEGETTKNIEVLGEKVVYLSGYISEDRTLYNDTIYVIQNDLRINAVVTVEAGTIIKLDENAIIYCTEGKIIANGTSTSRIILTSFKDDSYGGDTNGDGSGSSPKKGDWMSISIEGTSNASEFSYCNFFYGGGEALYDYTLNIASGNAKVQYCTFANNISESYGALHAGDAETGVLINSNTFYNNGIPFSINGTFDIDESNVFSNPENPAETNQKNGIYYNETYAKSITGDRCWQETEVPFVINAPSTDLTINNGNSLTISPGVIVKFRTGMGIHVNEGRFLAEGTAGEKIIFTSLKDDIYGGDTNGDDELTHPQPGDWDHIRIEGVNNNSSLKYCLLSYGGADPDFDFTLLLNSDHTSVDNCIFKNNTGTQDGTLNVEDGLSNTQITNNIFFNNEIPLAIGGKLDIDDSNIFHNPDNPSVTNTKNGIFVMNIDDGVVGTRSWSETEVPFVIPGEYNTSLDIDAGNSLYLAPGVIVKFQSNNSLLYTGTNLYNHDAEGVWFTSYKDDTKGGDTNGDGSMTSPSTGDWEGIYNSSSGLYESWTNIIYAGTVK